MLLPLRGFKLLGYIRKCDMDVASFSYLYCFVLL